MNSSDLGDALLGDDSYPDKHRLIAAEARMLSVLPIAESSALIDRLYQRSVQLRESQQSDRAFEMGRLIRRIGVACGEPAHVALGNMVCGDALNAQGKLRRAWAYFERANWRFAHIGDDLGWARTVIGRLFCALEVGAGEQVLEHEFRRARDIFKAHRDYRRWVILQLNAAILQREQTNFREALHYLKTGLKIARRSRAVNATNIPLLWNMIAIVYGDQGDARRAAHYFRRLYRNSHKADDPRQFFYLQSIAAAEMAQGRYRAALKRLDYVLRQVPHDRSHIRHFVYQNQIECYLEINDFRRARTLLIQFLGFPELAQMDRAWATTFLCRALAELEDFDEAQIALENAQSICRQLNVESTTARVGLVRGQLALRRAAYGSALDEAHAILDFFKEKGQYIELANIYLLMASALWKQGIDHAMMRTYCQEVLTIGQRFDSPSHIYGAYLYFGHLARAEGAITEAKQAYQSAINVINELQHDLTIVLRPTFLGDKGEATVSLIELCLEQNQIREAFETLENSKAQVFFECLADADSVHWLTDEASRSIQRELNQLRADYLGFRRKAQESTPDSPTDELTQAEVTQMKELIVSRTRELYNSRSATDRRALYVPASLTQIQAQLPAKTMLIAYYDDGQTIHAFLIDGSTIAHYKLSTSQAVKTQMNHLGRQVQIAISALQWITVEPDGTNPLTILKDGALNDNRLKTSFERSAGTLYEMLIAPLAERLSGCERLFIVPYGGLHNLPFHLLYRASRVAGGQGCYLIEDHEVIVLPTASLILRKPPQGTPGATIIYDDWDSQLRHSGRDAERVHDLIGGPHPHLAKDLDLDQL